jgi:phosphoribosylamine--glycine ligase
MRILIVGNGGREHALLWKLQRDAPSAEFFATRPNGGMASLCTPVPIGPMEVEALAGWAASQRIDLTIVGPEAPLASGIVDRFQAKGLPIFGPTRDAARIESSKEYAKELMRNAGIPTAEHRTFREPAAAEAYIRERGAPIVVKASGLAAGKGAVVCMTEEEGTGAVRSMLGDLTFGEAGRVVVVEDYMEGEELSVFAVADGTSAVLLLPSQDHKRVGEGDTGPNTGGMGAYAPVAIASGALIGEVRARIVEPTLRALAADGCPFSGLLYAGLMNTDGGLQVVEFNCRFGDPETQAVLPLMSSSLLELLATAAEGGSLAGADSRWSSGAAVTTVVASGGYPGAYDKGKLIDLPPELDSDTCAVFHAGTIRQDGRLVTAGGRVLAVTGLGSTFSEARQRSRAGAAAVSFEGAFYRSDIGWREQARSAET